MSHLGFYSTVLFDLDHTLWDYDTNAEDTLKELFLHYGFQDHVNGNEEDFALYYKKVNNEMWKQYEAGLINKSFLREERFKRVFARMGLPQHKMPERIWEQYLMRCPEKTTLIPGAIDILTYLNGKYEISIVSNGFEETQGRKVRNSGLDRFVEHVFTSEAVGYHKPELPFFQHVLQVIGRNPSECIIIGDTPETDLLGGELAGIDAIFFNPFQNETTISHKYEIKSLKELIDLL